MLVVQIQLWPAGDKERAQHLGTAVIANVGGTSIRGDYRMNISKKAGRGVWKSAETADFPRKRLGPWDLLFRLLRDCIGERNADSG